MPSIASHQGSVQGLEQGSRPYLQRCGRMIGSRSINGIGQGGLEHEHFGTVKTIPQATLELLLHMGNVNGQFRGTINIKEK